MTKRFCFFGRTRDTMYEDRGEWSLKVKRDKILADDLEYFEQKTTVEADALFASFERSFDQATTHTDLCLSGSDF